MNFLDAWDPEKGLRTWRYLAVIIMMIIIIIIIIMIITIY
jgi:hypothetical protein